MSIFSNFLNLFKYQPTEDAQNTFNIKTALNDNWDKVDTFAANVSQSMEHKADLVDGKVPSNQLPAMDYAPTDHTHIKANITDFPSSLPANGGNADSVSDKTASGTLSTTEKTNLVTAINECFQFASNGKSSIATTLNNKGVTCSIDDTFTVLAAKIAAQMCKFNGTAMAWDVLEGKTFINNTGNLVNGTMPYRRLGVFSLPINGHYIIPEGFYRSGDNIIDQSIPTKSEATITPSTVNQTISAGQYLSGAQTIVGSANLIAANIKNGVDIFGVLGTSPVPVGTAVASDVLVGKTFSNTNNTGLSGTMPNQGNVNATLTTQNQQYTIPAGYHAGSGRVAASFSNLIAGNIKKGVNVGGVVGTLQEGTICTTENFTSPIIKITGTLSWSNPAQAYILQQQIDFAAITPNYKAISEMRFRCCTISLNSFRLILSTADKSTGKVYVTIESQVAGQVTGTFCFDVVLSIPVNVKLSVL